MHAWQIGEIFGNLEFNRGGKLRERMKMLDKIEMPNIKCMVQRKARIYSNLYKYFMKKEQLSSDLQDIKVSWSKV